MLALGDSFTLLLRRSAGSEHALRAESGFPLLSG